MRFGKVLVTGAGGSIGAALCRAIEAEELVLFEQNEYALYQIDESLTCKRVAVLGDVRDAERVTEFMRGVDTVFHCAAYKHVPLLQGVNAYEAIKTNVGGTRAVMEAARHCRAAVLLSTDKAVNPASVMGRSKLEAEHVARAHGRTVARLGNVLESSGSVVPKFRAQIAAGGPVTVTHPQATRYFISMDTAVAFLLDCAHRAPGTYQADMGEAVNIFDLARQMIGDKDVMIEFIGLRPGEKLHEELEELAA